MLTSPEGTRYLFDPGALCLELLLTGGPRELARHEVLHRPDDLATWLSSSRLDLSSEEVRVTHHDLAAARRLREALWNLARAAADGRPRRVDDFAVVNDVAARPPMVPRITEDGMHTWQVPVKGAQALSTVARDAVELFTGRHADRIRECGAHDCYLIFVDTSRPGRRRWCAMERCGNRHKVRALRARRDSEENAES